jgi:hypothetical protein
MADFRWNCPRCGSYAQGGYTAGIPQLIETFGVNHRCVPTGVPPVRPARRQRRRQRIAGSRRVGGVA